MQSYLCKDLSIDALKVSIAEIHSKPVRFSRAQSVMNGSITSMSKACMHCPLESAMYQRSTQSTRARSGRQHG
jgi:hypothetical protein